MTLSKCCDAKADTDIMICSDCLEHLGDEDIWDDEVVKYYNPRNKLGVEWDVVPVRWSNGVPFGGTNSNKIETYMEKTMDTREELKRDEYLTRIKESLRSYKPTELIEHCLPRIDWVEWGDSFDACTSKEEYDDVKWELVTYIAENELYHDFLGE